MSLCIHKITTVLIFHCQDQSGSEPLAPPYNDQQQDLSREPVTHGQDRDSGVGARDSESRREVGEREEEKGTKDDDEVIEESGPVQYSDGEEEEGAGGFGDVEMDELAYEGDPLLYSDGEEGTVILYTTYYIPLLSVLLH